MTLQFKFILCALATFLAALIFAPLVIFVCKRMKASQTILHYVDKHASKQGTPTMGGFIFLIPLLISLFFIDFSSKFSALFLLIITFGYALLGFLDDFIKVRYQHNEGLKPYQKIIGQFGLALIVALYMYFSGRTSLNFFNLNFNIGFFIIPLVILVLIATTNSVNLTDGLDGLAGGTSLVYVLFFGILLALFKSIEFNNLAMMCFSLCGGLVAFLIFNCYPAKYLWATPVRLGLEDLLAQLLCFQDSNSFFQLWGLCLFCLACLTSYKFCITKEQKRGCF